MLVIDDEKVDVDDSIELSADVVNEAEIVTLVKGVVLVDANKVVVVIVEVSSVSVVLDMGYVVIITDVNGVRVDETIDELCSGVVEITVELSIVVDVVVGGGGTTITFLDIDFLKGYKLGNLLSA